MIKEREKELSNWINQKEKMIHIPEGKIRANKVGNNYYYFLREKPSDRKGIYMPSSKQPMVRKMIQSEYDQLVLSSAKKEMSIIKKMERFYSKEMPEDVYYKMPEGKRLMVKPIVETDEQYLQAWLAEEYEGKSFYDENTEYYSEKGERMRSKSEVLIANMLVKYGIPYKYEKPLYLKGIGRVYPDFTLLDIKKRKEIYWEHMGMLDDREYREMALNKIIRYEENDIFPGNRLILTHETMKQPLNMKIVEKIIIRLV